MTNSIDPGVWDEFVIPLGANWGRPLLVEVDGVPLNLTGYSAKMQLKADYADVEPLVELTNGAGITLGGAAGTIDLSITAAQTESIPFGTGRVLYDIELTDGAGVVTRILMGTMTLLPEVTI